MWWTKHTAIEFFTIKVFFFILNIFDTGIWPNYFDKGIEIWKIYFLFIHIFCSNVYVLLQYGLLSCLFFYWHLVYPVKFFCYCYYMIKTIQIECVVSYFMKQTFSVSVLVWQKYGSRFLLLCIEFISNLSIGIKRHTRIAQTSKQINENRSATKKKLAIITGKGTRKKKYNRMGCRWWKNVISNTATVQVGNCKMSHRCV